MRTRVASGCVGAALLGSAAALADGGGVAGGATPPPQEFEVVDLGSLRNHDLFDGPAAPLFRVERYEPVVSPVPFAWDPKAAPDAVLLGGSDAKGAPASVRVPVGRAARTVYVLTAAQGAVSAKGIAADGEIQYADGRRQALKWMVGEQIWPAWAGATGRGADVVPVGWNASGDLLTASLLTVDVSWPEAPIDAITVTTRGGALSFAVLGVTTSTAAPVTAGPVADRREGEWYDFRIPGVLPASLPSLVPVAGPVARPIVVRDGHLAYDGGGRARFWGINLVREGALPAADVAADYAQSLANAGFNLVRPHHMDFEGAGSLLNPNRGEPGEPLALPEALDRMDRFHAERARAGVYTWLETWTLRSFRAEEGLPSSQGLPVGHKYAPFYWPEYADAKKAWVRAVYDRTNPYTGLRYADDPSIAVVELANEDSLVSAWGGGMLERLPGPHRQRLDERWNAWLRARYKTDTALSNAWKGSVRGGLQLGETLSLDSVAREPATRARTELYPTPRAADLVAFYAELEAAHHADMARFFKEELGFGAPTVCNTSFGSPSADALLAACDIVDMHIYWDPIAESNVFFDHALVERPMHGRPLERLSWCQEGKPCTVSELNHTWPNRYAHEAPMVWASLLARQDLDAVLWFTYSHGPFAEAPDGPGGALDLSGRFSSWAQMPTASALFRSGAVAPPARRFIRWWSPDAILRDLAEPSSLWIDAQVSWRAALDTVSRTSFAPTPPAPIGGDVEVSPARWWPDEGRWVVDTPTIQALVGRTDRVPADTSQGAVHPSGLRAELSSFAAVSYASLDGAPLGESRRALLTIAGRTERDGTVRSTGGPGTLVYGLGPARLERLQGSIDVRWQGRPEAWALGPTGEPERRLPIRSVGSGWWRIDPAGVDSPWVELRSRR
jgi:hypothetical protein